MLLECLLLESVGFIKFVVLVLFNVVALSFKIGKLPPLISRFLEIIGSDLSLLSLLRSSGWIEHSGDFSTFVFDLYIYCYSN
jgi:hypothetical protein